MFWPENGPGGQDTYTIQPLMAGTFFHGDNLDVLRYWIDDETIDLVYLDPPFNSQQDFNLLFGAEGATDKQQRAFRDTWWWDDTADRAYEELTRTKVGSLPEKLPGLVKALYDFLYPQYRHAILSYLVNMAIRLVELHRVMKPTASLYLHCDPTASHYLKMILDSIFGLGSFRNEVVWKRSYSHNSAKKYGPVHDVILFYTKGETYTWNPAWTRLPQKTIDQWYNNIEAETGRRFNRADLTGSGKRGGDSGKPWRGIDPDKKGRHWAIPRNIEILDEIIGDLKTFDALDALDADGRLFWPEKEGGVPMFKRYIEEAVGVPALDVITRIPHLHNKSPERVGYPTQKPLALLQHIIELSSNPGDLVLDPFCGCGTSIIACEKLGRQWFGIDIGEEAINVLRHKRLPKEAPGCEIREAIEPFDVESARRLASLPDGEYRFQWWAVRKIGGAPRYKKGGDRGIDGDMLVAGFDGSASRRVIVSVKTGATPQPAWVDGLYGAVNNPVHKAHMGVLITLTPPTAGMRDRAREYGRVPATVVGKRDPYKIQIITADDIFKSPAFGLDLPGNNVTASSPRPPIISEVIKGQLGLTFPAEPGAPGGPAAGTSHGPAKSTPKAAPAAKRKPKKAG